MKYLFLFLAAAIADCCDAQNINLPNDTILYHSLANFHEAQVSAQLEEFEISTKGNWMNYVPSAGVGYTPQGEPRPTVSFSLAQIFTAQRNREAIEAKRRAITKTANIAHQTEIRELEALLRQLEILLSDLEFSKTILQIDQQLFDFYETQHQNSEITASAFLLKQRDLLIKKQGIKNEERIIEEEKMKILSKAKMKINAINNLN